MSAKYGSNCVPFPSLISLFTSSCSEDTEQVGEYDNWQEKNDAAIAKWATNSSLRKIITFSKNASTSGTNNDYIYVEVLQEGSGTESPLYSDSVRVAYRGHYIPTESSPQGYVFDQSFTGDFSWATAGATTLVTSSFVDGFTTALMNMHVGDLWRVYIPYDLGYGNPSSKSSILDASNLVFEMALVDFWHPGDQHTVLR